MNKNILITWARSPMARLAVVVVGLALAAAALVHWLRPARENAADTQPTSKVQRGPLTISLTQAGTIQAAEQQIITCEVEGSTTLIYLIEEGVRVKPGDLLAELDASNLQDRLVEQQIRVQNAEAAYIRARENLAVTKSQCDSDIALARLNDRFAKEDLSQYTEGQYKQDLLSAESKITLAEEEIQLAGKKLEWSEKLFKENYISQSEYDADRLSHNRAKLDLELSKASKQLLENYTYTRKLAQLKSDVDQAERALERVQLKAAADIVQADADLKAKEAEWRQQQNKQTKIEDQLAKTRIVATRAGQVIYATSVKQGGRFRNQEPLEAGQEVRERQELIYLPTANAMIASVQVHESNLNKIHPGLPVIVTVDALKGKSFMGKVLRISPLPDAMSMWINPDLKVYQTEITIEESHPGLRSGMSCMAEIVVDRYDDALYVPVQAVLRVNNQPTVYVRRGLAFRPVPVTLGMDNNRVVHIVAGLEADETVLLTPPLQDGARKGEEATVNGTVETPDLTEMIRKAQNGKTTEAETKPVSEKPAPTVPEASKGGERQALTQEQRDAMRQRLEAMTPEQRAEAAARRGRNRDAGAPAGGSAP